MNATTTIPHNQTMENNKNQRELKPETKTTETILGDIAVALTRMQLREIEKYGRPLKGQAKAADGFLSGGCRMDELGGTKIAGGWEFPDESILPERVDGQPQR